MPHSFGYRAHTRHLFKRDFRKNGMPAPATYLRVFKIGQIVDIKGDGSVHKGMPHKFYHGKTGIIWNVTKRAVGVEVNKLIGNRIIAKRIHVRIEHVKHSGCRQEFLDRVAANEVKKAAAKASGKKIVMKRLPAQPQKGGMIRKPVVETLTAMAYTGLNI